MIRWFLSNLIATFTGPRYFPEFEWSYLWTHNIFRFFGMIFGEAYAIRKSASAELVNGVLYQVGYTAEAQFALYEIWIRRLLRGFAPRLVLIPTYQLVGMPKTLVPYRFAIALDTSAKSAASPGSASYSYTVTGSNPLLACGITGDTTDTITTVTYNSVAVASVQKRQYTGDRWIYLRVLAGPSTGANTFAINGTTFRNSYVSSYTGCAQSGQPDSSAQANGSTTTPTVSTTVVAANSWIVSFIYGESPVATAVTIAGSAGVIRQVQSTEQLADSNATVSTGSQSTVWNNNTAARETVCLTMSIAPVSVAIVNSGFFFAVSK